MTQIWGITGGIGMGKSTVAAQFADCGVPLLCSDAVVHDLLAPGGAAVEPVAARFPSVRAEDGGIDRAALGSAVFGDAAALEALEALLHPLVWQAQARFITMQRRRRQRRVLLDIPLLFETGAQARLDRVIAVHCPVWLQRLRVLARPGMSEAKLQSILARQWPGWQKRKAADWVIETGLGKAYSLRQVKKVLADDA